jgi:hypothetical protein
MVSIVDRFSISDTEAVFNEASIDSDFRVESDANTHAFFLEGSTGNIGIGTSSIDVITQAGGSGFRVLQIENDEGGQINLDHNDAGTGSTLGMINFNRAGETVAHIAGVTDGATDSGYINFRTQPASGALTERMRITGDGFFKFSTTGAYKATAQFHEFTNSSGSQQALYCRHLDSSNPYGLEVRFDAAAPDDNTHWAFNFSDTSAARFRVESDGDVQNHDNAYGSISDERIKQDIVDANSQWNDIKAVRVRNYKKKDDVRQYGDNAWSQIGVIAQELENVSPKLVKHSDPSPSDILSNAEFGTLYEDGDDIPEGKAIGDIKTTTNEKVKSVSYSVLYMKAIKALQEAMTRIETLEAEVTALKG